MCASESDDGNQEDNNDCTDDEDVPNCDEAPADDDVVITDANIGSPSSTKQVRRSSRLNN